MFVAALPVSMPKASDKGRARRNQKGPGLDLTPLNALVRPLLFLPFNLECVDVATLFLFLCFSKLVVATAENVASELRIFFFLYSRRTWSRWFG